MRGIPKTGSTSTTRAWMAYGVALLICLLVMLGPLGMLHADFRVPYGYTAGGDALLMSLLVKGVQENGWYLHNPSVGAPTGLDLHDFPFGDTLHFAVLRLLTLGMPAMAAENVFILLSFPLTALTALFVFRRLGFSDPGAIAGSLVFAFLPGHLQRAVGQAFLGHTELIPLTLLVALWLYCGDARLHRERPPGESLPIHRCRSALVLSVLTCVLLSLTGFYYALLGAFFLAAAGVFGAVGRRRLWPVLTAAALVGVIFAGIVASASPTIRYRRHHGLNREVGVRTASQSELLGLKVAQLVMPVEAHSIPSFARKRAEYNQEMLLTLDNGNSLGLVAGAGFLFLLACVALPAGIRLPFGVRPAAALNIMGILFGTVGGFGSLVAFFISPQLRAYSRISFYLAFCCTFAVVSCLDSLYRKAGARPLPRLATIALIATLCLSILTDLGWSALRTMYATPSAPFERDARFVQAVEASLPPGSGIFQLPYVSFPEGQPAVMMGNYEHLRMYLHSKTLRWSFGAMRGREGDPWQQAVAVQPVPRMVELLTAAGFRGIYLDRHGFIPFVEAKLEADLRRYLGPPRVVSEDSRRLFFSLENWIAQRQTAVVR